MTTQPASISVTAPVSLALDRVKRVLFQPFDLGKWFVIGFCAWLAHLGDEGFRTGGGGGSRGDGKGGIQQEFERARDYVMDNLHWLVPVIAAVILASIALWLVLLWLNSRGKFMFLHCVALNKAEVAEPWRKFAREANSLWVFRIVFGLVSLAAMLPFLVLGGIGVYGMVAHEQASVGGILMVGAAVLAIILLAIVVAIINKFTMDFVVPLMFLRGKRCVETWREFRPLLSAYAGSFVLYILFQILISLALGVMVFALVLLTCCIAGCLLAIPYLGTVLFLPVLVFLRSYSLYFLAQFGREYDVFAPATV